MASLTLYCCGGAATNIGKTFHNPGKTMPGFAQIKTCFIDTSGSIGERDLQIALGSVRSILQAFSVEKLHIIYWDDGVAGHEVYSLVDDQVVEQTHPVGGGGTSFAPVLGYLNKHKIRPSFGVCFTDGYIGDWGRDPGWPMLWVVSTDQQAPWGRQVRYTEGN